MAPVDAQRCLHVWVKTTDGRTHPGIVVAWRRGPEGWQAYVAVALDGSVLLTWHPGGDLRPVADDRPSR